METATADAVAEELQAMREARLELGRAEGYLSTEKALEFCQLDICEDTLVGYPSWVCPRLRKNPKCPTSDYQWDPRDIRALPIVLKQWQKARKAGEEEEFRRRRDKMLDDRDQKALVRAWGGGR